MVGSSIWRRSSLSPLLAKRFPRPLLSPRAPAARFPTAVNEPQGTSTRRAGSFADKIGCVMKHLRRIRDDGVRRRQARRWLNIAGDGDGDDDEDDGDDDGDDDDDEGNGAGDDAGDDCLCGAHNRANAVRRPRQAVALASQISESETNCNRYARGILAGLDGCRHKLG